MSEKLKELHEVLATELLKRVKDPDAKSADLNVARQFLKDNNIDAVPNFFCAVSNCESPNLLVTLTGFVVVTNSPVPFPVMNT